MCSHLTSGEKEGNELKRNIDVAEILKSTQFPRICRTSRYRIPERILEHEYVLVALENCNLNFSLLSVALKFLNHFFFNYILHDVDVIAK